MSIRLFYPHISKEIDAECFNELCLKIQPTKPFSADVIEFLDKFSTLILTDSVIKQEIDLKYKELFGLAFFCRKANILRIKKQFDDKVLLSRGHCLHITPSNVGIMFFYSWIMSLLAGNSNFIRVSEKNNDIVSFVCNLLTTHECFSTLSIKDNTIIFTCSHEDTILNILSEASDARLVWGGDSTVDRIIKMDTPTGCKDVKFLNKQSIALIKSSSILTDPIKAGKALINDVKFFNQKACSSPQTVYFLGSKEDNLKASKLLWEYISNNYHLLDNSKSLNTMIVKNNFKYKLAADGYSGIKEIFLKPLVLSLPTSDSINYLPMETCGVGTFFQDLISDLGQINLKQNVQTIAYYGFTKQEMINFVNNYKQIYKTFNLPNVNRIVPLGMSLDFDYIWDGYNIIQELTREVNIK